MLAWLSALTLAAAPAPRCVQILGTNDLHGHIEAEARSTKAGPGEKPLSVQEGGLAALGGYLHVLRAKYPGQTLLLDGGDLFQGTVASNLSKGAAVIAAYDALGYQAASLGNHEFDFGPEGHEADLLGAIKQRVAEAHFPFLACNLYERATGKRPAWKNLKPSVLMTINGVKVGVIGAITPDTPTVTVPLNVTSLDFRDPAPEVIAEASRLRKQGAQLVVLVAHIGAECGRLDNTQGLTRCNPKSELFQLIEALPPGTLDVAVGGHTHQYVAQMVNGVAVTEAGSYGAAFGWVQACVAPTGKVELTLHPPVDLCLQDWAEGGCRARSASTGVVDATFLGEKVAPDAPVAETLAPFLARVKTQQQAPIGVTLATAATRRHDAPSALGLLIAQAIRAAVPGADLGLTNAGGIRAELPAGALTWGQVFEVLPFDNRVVSLRLTGKQLEDFLAAPLLNGHGYPQVSGATYVFDRAHPEAAHLTFADGSRVDPNKEYVLATNDFLANGGDATKSVMQGVPVAKRAETGLLVRDAFLDFIEKQPQPVKVPAVPEAR